MYEADRVRLSLRCALLHRGNNAKDGKPDTAGMALNKT